MKARRPWAWPLVPLYALTLRVQEAMRGAGWLRAKKLAWPVVSVGSLSAGGAGKTPVVIALAKMLAERGWKIDVLSRGYGRTGSGVARVDAGAVDAARAFGDEPMLIAQRAGVDVWVGAERFAAGLRAEAGAGGSTAVGEQQILRSAQDDKPLGMDDKGEAARLAKRKVLHLLDDGFQHRQLARDVDIALVTAEDLEDALLPAGNRREPLEALRRADFVAIREEEMEAVESRVKPLMRSNAILWTIRRTLRFPAPLFVFGAGLRPAAFCAIARPENFAAMLKQAGCGIVDTIYFDDHHAYTMKDVESIVENAKTLGASGLVTTEKDAVKLTEPMRERLASVGPLMVAGLDLEFIFPERVMRELEARLP